VRIVALLTIRRSELERARGYEHAAHRMMARYGGRIEHAYELDDGGETLRWLHVVEWPDQAAFSAYLADPERTAHAADRAKAIVATEVWPATELPR
jgi:uncharacterized protein (DUF1330 family)